MIKAVPQTYAGTRFRSTLEADWAATLDAHGQPWRYEPEAVELPSGTLYRPDFWLPELGSWLEVKGPSVPGAEKAVELALTTGQWVVLGGPGNRGLVSWRLLGLVERGDRATTGYVRGWLDKHAEVIQAIGQTAEIDLRGRMFRAPR